MKIVQVNGKHYQECDVIMLPKENSKSHIFLQNDKLMISDGFGNQELYITSNEEIKDGDWVLNTNTNLIAKYTGHGSMDWWVKIILTTDQDLIKDGVQSIDDEFLEWFVNNPSCEEVDVCKVEQIPDGITFGMFGNDEPPTELIYKIIIPQEEPKQETLEEAAKKQWGNVHRTGVLGFIDGAKWQAERMYSEEEVIELLQKYRFDLSSGKTANIGDTTKFWFEQFKKK